MLVAMSKRLRSYISFTVGLLWLAAAIYFWRNGIGLYFPFRVSRNLANRIFYAFITGVFLGWLVPLAIGVTLLVRQHRLQDDHGFDE